jgi:hypothetical protein
VRPFDQAERFLMLDFRSEKPIRFAGITLDWTIADQIALKSAHHSNHF